MLIILGIFGDKNISIQTNPFLPLAKIVIFFIVTNCFEKNAFRCISVTSEFFTKILFSGIPFWTFINVHFSKVSLFLFGKN